MAMTQCDFFPPELRIGSEWCSQEPSEVPSGLRFPVQSDINVGCCRDTPVPAVTVPGRPFFDSVFLFPSLSP